MRAFRYEYMHEYICLFLKFNGSFSCLAKHMNKHFVCACVCVCVCVCILIKLTPAICQSVLMKRFDLAMLFLCSFIFL